MNIQLIFNKGPFDGRVNYQELEVTDRLPPETIHLPIIEQAYAAKEGYDPTIPSINKATYHLIAVVGLRTWVYEYG